MLEILVHGFPRFNEILLFFTREYGSKSNINPDVTFTVSFRQLILDIINRHSPTLSLHVN